MRRLSMVTIVGLIVFVVAGLGAVVAWERQANAAEINTNRRERIEQAFTSYGPESGGQYAGGYAQESPDAWRAAALVLGCAAVCGALSAGIGHVSRSSP